LVKYFSYVTDVCSAAIHGGKVTYDHALEALELGAKLLTFLNEIFKEEGLDISIVILLSS